MAKTVIALEATMNASGAEGSVKSLKAQLREAQAEVATMADKFGLTSDAAQQAAKKAAQLKDAIGDAKLLTDAFNPDAKFKSFSNAISGVVGGFSALQGAQALFGDQSEDLAKTLAKVQGAMALSQGINSVLEAKDAFKVLSGVIKTNVVTSLTTLRGALIATGIGALAVGVGLLVANFDAVKDAVLKFIPGLKSVADFVGKLINKITDFIGVTSEATRAQEKFIKDTEKQIKKTDEFLDSQGYKYDEFTQRKIKANNEYRKHEIEIAKDTTKTEVEKQALLKAYRDKADYEIRQADEDRLAKQKENGKAVVKEHKNTNAQIVQETEQARKARESAETLMLDIELERINTIEQAESDAFDEKFLNYQEDLQNQQDASEISYQLAWEDYQAKKKLTELEKENKLKAASEIANSSMALAELVGKQTAVGKGLAIAATTIETYSAAQSAYKRGMEVPYVGMVLGPLNAAIAVAQGIQRVKAITAVKVPGGGGGGNLPSLTGGGGVGAPIGAQMGTTALQQAQINAAGSAAVQAFVLESDVSGNQERIERLNRAARIQ